MERWMAWIRRRGSMALIEGWVLLVGLRASGVVWRRFFDVEAGWIWGVMGLRESVTPRSDV